MKKVFFLFTACLLSFLITQAQCSIEITGITSAGPGDPPSVNIIVSGKILNGICNKVDIKLCCNTPTSNLCRTQTVDVSADGSWSTLFKNFLCPCVSGSFVVIAKVSCASGTCTPDEERATINCPSAGSCPQVLSVTTSIGNCVNDNSGCAKRDVVFTPNISGTCDGFNWNFGDNSLDENGSGIPGNQTHSYFHTPQTTPKLTIFKAGCPIVTFPIPLSIPACDVCPASGAINLNSLTVSKCVLNGPITATICEEQYINFVIDYGDGQTETAAIGELNGKQINHTYISDGNYNFKIILIRDGSNCTYSKSITVSNCVKCKDCPDDSNDGDSGNCGWRFWECLCGWLAFFVGAWVTTSLILTAFGWGLVTLPLGGTFSWSAVFEAIGLGFAIWIATLCPCATAIAIAIGAATAFVTILVLLNNGFQMPRWLQAIVIAFILVIIMLLYITNNC